MTTRGQSRTDAGRRPGRRRWVGVALALAALWLQVAATGFHLLLPFAAAPGDMADAARLYGAHALCIAADPGGPNAPTPGDQPPAAPAHYFAACCPGHHSIAPYLPPRLAAAPVVFVCNQIVFPGAATFAVAARPAGTARARAPPIDA